MEAIAKAVAILRKHSGAIESSVVQFIDWENTYKDDRGVRAPAWRQDPHGDLAYISVKLLDATSKEPMTITANKKGFWFIKNGDKDEKASEVFQSIPDLLKSVSPAFEEKFSKLSPSFNVLLTMHLEEEESDENEKENSAELLLPPKVPHVSLSKKRIAMRHLKPCKVWGNLGLDDELISEIPKTAQIDNSAPSSAHSIYRAPTRGPTSTRDFLSDSETSEDEEEEKPLRAPSADLPPEYWSIQKLVKFLSGGNQTATIIALCSLRDFDLKSETCQFAIKDVGGLDVLINLLETEDFRCRNGALQVLLDISTSRPIAAAISALNGMQPLVGILDDDYDELKCLAALVIANCASFRRNRKRVRNYGGIHKLVRLLETPLDKNGHNEVARCGALALWSCSKSDRNIKEMLKAGLVKLLASLLSSTHVPLLIPVIGVLQQCAKEASFRFLIRTEGMIPYLIANLSTNGNVELQSHCACTLFMCGEDPETRELIRNHNGLVPLVALLAQTQATALIEGATGAIWKCALDEQNRAIFVENKAVEQLVALLQGQESEAVLRNVVGALSELALHEKARKLVRSAGGIPPLVQLLTGTNQGLLVNVTKAVGCCARDADNMAIIDKLDGVLLLWTLLKTPNPIVQANAAWAIALCIENAKDAGEMVRSLVGGLELIVGLLKSEDIEVLASVCAAIANIAKDEENLAVITDHGVVALLSKLTRTSEDLLRAHLAAAISQCSTWGNNRAAFGETDAVAPLVRYLYSKDPLVHKTTTLALSQLSKEPANCVTMHEHGVVPILIDFVGSADPDVQTQSAACLKNIRTLALLNEKAKYNPS